MSYGAMKSSMGLGTALVLMVMIFQGCPQDKYITCKSNEEYNAKLGVCIPCPVGTALNKKTGRCAPVSNADVVIPPWDTADDQSETDLNDSVGPDLRLDLTDAADGEIDVPTDVPKVDIYEVAQQGSIGSECNTSSECDGDLASCFDWPDGYCIKSPCNSSDECPEGSACLPLLENGQACFDLCTVGAECRPGYACKALPELGGEAKSVCHPVDSQAKSVGSPCTGASQCAGDLACVSLGPVSMCTSVGCTTTSPCPSGMECVAWSTQTVCLPTCVQGTDCNAEFQEQISCEKMKNITNQNINVCTAAKFGLGIGLQCYFDTECSSGYCHLIFKGKCSDSGLLCSSDQDCNMGFCVDDPGSHRGLCSKPCGSSDSCPSGNACVIVGEGPVCMPNCSEYGQECGPEGLGMKCSYGLIYWPQVASGKTACVRLATGEAGTPCKADAQCLDGDCYNTSGNNGFCMEPCQSNTQCSFSTACIGNQCMKICLSDVDCPEGMVCKSSVSSSEFICDY